MVYKNKFVSSIKVDNKVLKEFPNDVIKMKFMSEYSIYMKNLSTVRAIAKIKIDGENVSGGGIILDPGESIDFERFIKSDRKFKFIEMTKGIEEFRGIKTEDGLIQVTYSFERVSKYSKPLKNCGLLLRTTGVDSGGRINCMNNISSISSLSVENTSGITSEGSVSSQKFNTVIGFPTGTKDTIIFKIEGFSEDNSEALESSFVKSKKKCPNCGSQFKSKFEFCPNDGSLLKSITSL